MEENLKRQYENQMMAVKENEERRRQRDVKQVKEELEMENLAKINNLRQELLTTHNDQVNRMRQDHQREIERLMSISGQRKCYRCTAAVVWLFSCRIFVNSKLTSQSHIPQRFQPSGKTYIAMMWFLVVKLCSAIF